MKFNQYLKHHRVPEWRSAYIDYRKLKKALKQAVNNDQQDSTERDTESDQHGDVESDGGDRSMPINFDPAQHDLPTEVDGHTGIASGEISSDPESMDLKLTSSPEPILKRSASARSGASSSKSATKKSPESRKPRVMTASLRRAGGWRFSPSTPLQKLLPQLNDAERKFFSLLVKELDKIEGFYGEREDRAIQRFKDIAEQLDELEKHRKAHEAARKRDPTLHLPAVVRDAMPGAVVNSAKRAKHYITHVDGTAGGPARHSTDPTKNDLGEQQLEAVDDLVKNVRPDTYTRARKALKAAIFEEYRFLGMLKSYRTLNRQGFSKALKKAEKNLRIPCSTSFMHRVNDSRFVSSTKLDELTSQAESMFALHFEGGSRKRALTRLRMVGQKKTHHAAAGRSGIWLGAAAPALIDGIVRSCLPSTHERIPHWPALMQIYGALFLPVALACSLMLNLTVWHRARINFSLIFEFDVRTMMDWHQYLELPSFLLFLLSYAFWLSMNDFWPDTVSPQVWPLAWVVTTVVILINPFPILHLHARYWLLGRVGRILTMGIVPSLPVTFPDFYLGDLLTSLYYLFYNFGFFICAYNRDFDDVPPRCNTNGTWASPALAMIPALARFGQSIRRYIDSDGSSVHALNAGKYAATIIYYWCYFNWRIKGSEMDGTLALFLVAAIVNSVYTSSWDVVMDWGLFNLRSKNWLLRNDLVFKGQNAWYYVAIVANTILRFTWILYLTPGPSVPLRGFIVSLTEVFRRFVWSFFRLESEQVGVADSYRVTRDVPLPFAVDKKDGDDEEETMGEGFLSNWALHPVVRALRRQKPVRDGSQEAIEQEAGSPPIPRATTKTLAVDSSASEEDEGDTEEEGSRV